MVLTIYTIRVPVILFSADERLETGKLSKWKEISGVPLRTKKDDYLTTSQGSLEFPDGFSGKLLFHLTFNQNFRIFSLNGNLAKFQIFYSAYLRFTQRGHRAKCSAASLPKNIIIKLQLMKRQKYDSIKQ